MPAKFNPALLSSARELRRNMTKEERHLWYDFLRTYPVKFTKQKIIGNYIVDFYCADAKIVIELDGSQHFEPEAMEHDAVRTAFLNSFGLNVYRIPNSEVNKNFTGVCEYIDCLVKYALPLGSPSQGELSRRSRD